MKAARLLLCIGLLALARGRGEAAPAPDDAMKDAPAPLVCLRRHYDLQFQQEDGRYVLLLPGGARVPYDDGQRKDFAGRLAAPDIEDMFSIEYRVGPIREVTAPDDDPGRIRVEALFAAVYGQTREAVAAALVKTPFLGQPLSVHRRAAPAFARVAARLSKLIALRPALGPFLQGLGGTFVWRKIAGTTRQSAHSYGVSLDINVKRSHYWRWQRPAAPLRWQNQIPQEIVDAFEAEGFIWGGRWYHYDTMHFEYRPELLDSSCYPAASPPRLK